MKKTLICILVVVLILPGCSAFVRPPENMVKGRDIVCILYNETKFKKAVVENITSFIRSKGLKVTTDRVKRAKYYRTSDYTAVVYFAEYWQWHVPWHTKRYYRNNDTPDNVVFMITSGDPDVQIHDPFDAVTSASNPDSIERVSREVINKLTPVLQ